MVCVINYIYYENLNMVRIGGYVRNVFINVNSGKEVFMKVYEIDVVNEIIKYLKSIGIKDILTEVPLYDSCCDIVYIDEKHNFVCMEVKLTDWRVVIQQAIKLKSYTNQVYVAMPYPETEYRRKKIEDEVKPTGVGLYWFKDKQMACVFRPNMYMPTFNGKAKDTSIGFLKSHLAEEFYCSLNFTFLTRCIDYKSNQRHLY